MSVLTLLLEGGQGMSGEVCVAIVAGAAVVIAALIKLVPSRNGRLRVCDQHMGLVANIESIDDSLKLIRDDIKELRQRGR